MRKKIAKMKAGGRVAKYADGGTVRGRGISQGLRSSRASQPRVQEAERAMNVVSDEMDMPSMAPAPEAPLPVPPIPPRRARASRQRAMTADDLNDREMTRILNERSLEAARAGRNMYKRGGRVMAKCK